MIIKEKEKNKNLYRNPKRECMGFTLFSPLNSKSAYLVNMQGRVVHEWKLPNTASYEMKILENGNLLYMGKLEGSIMKNFEGCAGKLIELDWNSNVVWEYEDPYMHHTFFRKKNGNILYAKWIKVPDGFKDKIRGGVPGTEKDVMWTDAIVEIDSYGYVLYMWKAFENLDPKKNLLCPLEHRTEWTRLNSIYVKENENILVNFMLTNTAVEIDKNSGKILWYYTGELAHAHSISETENNNFLIFDNGLHTIYISFSRVIEVNSQTMDIIWEFKEDTIADFYSSILGGCQRLKNGNTLVCDSSGGRIIEVTPEKEVVWEYISPYKQSHEQYGKSNIIINAKRYSPDYRAFKNKSWRI